MQTQEPQDETRPLMLSRSAINVPESSLAENQSPTPTTNVQEYYNKPSTGEGLPLTSFRAERNAITPGLSANKQLSSLRTFDPHRGSEGNNQDYEIGTSVTFDVEKHVTLEMNITGAGHEATIQELDQNTEANALRKNEVVAGTFQEKQYSEDYLQPVESENFQHKKRNSPRLCERKAQTLTPRPRPKPRMKKLGRRETEKVQRKESEFSGPPLSRQFTDLRADNPPIRDMDFDQHCACVKTPNQSHRVNPQLTTFQGTRMHGYQNDRSPMTTYQNTTKQSSLRQLPGNCESPYARVNCNINWELPPGHLSLFKRIGGGSFGQVWKGTAYDVIGAKGWSVVAVKMLKGKKR